MQTDDQQVLDREAYGKGGLISRSLGRSRNQGMSDDGGRSVQDLPTPWLIPWMHDT